MHPNQGLMKEGENVDSQELAQILGFGHEQYGVEFKGPGSLKDSKFAAKVVRAILGMANKRDGGYVIIGVDDDLIPTGLSDNLLKTWNYDHVADEVSRYADPFVIFDLQTMEYNGNKIVVIRVHEFDEIPVICKKDYPPTLQRGGCYVRSLGKPETRHIPTQAEMRELLEIAVSKRMRNVLQFTGLRGNSDANTHPNHAFDQEIYNLNESEVATEIQSRGYWTMVLHPASYKAELIRDIGTLQTVVRSCSVDFSGWNFPHISPHETPALMLDWVEHETNWWNHIERWAFFQSGLFWYQSGYEFDWLERVEWSNPNPLWKPNDFFGVNGVIRKLTEMFEFSSRLLSSEAYAGVENVCLRITAHKLRGRSLSMEDPRRHIWNTYTANIENFPYDCTFSRIELITNAREFALDLADQIFKRFGLSLSRAVLTEIQPRQQ